MSQVMSRELPVFRRILRHDARHERQPDPPGQHPPGQHLSDQHLPGQHLPLPDPGLTHLAP
jgi:hypothetical protein